MTGLVIRDHLPRPHHGHQIMANSLFLLLHTSFHSFNHHEDWNMIETPSKSHQKGITLCSSITELVESACIKVSLWVELIYEAAQHSKPRVRSHTVLLGTAWLEMGERNHALAHPTIWFLLHTCTCTPRTHIHTHTHIHTCTHKHTRSYADADLCNFSQCHF